MAWTSSGETLFRQVRDEIIPGVPSTAGAWHGLNEMLTALGGSDRFPNYFRGALAVLAVRRLIRFWEDQRPFPARDAMWIRKISSFIKEEMFPELDADTIGKIARRVVRAATAAGQVINNSTRVRVIAAQRNHRCYLCGKTVDPRARDDDPERLTLDHVWPRAAGGESVEQNLLVACNECQQWKGEVFSWEWHNIHNVVLSPAPSERELGNLRWAFRFARYSYAAMEVAQERGITLREAFLANGPVQPSMNASQTGSPVTFFDLQLQDL